MNRFIEWLTENSAVIMCGSYAFIISLLTTKKGSLMDRINAALLCSFFSTGIYYAILSFFPDCSPYIAVAVGTFVGAFGVDECKNFIRLRLRKLLGGDTEEKDNKIEWVTTRKRLQIIGVDITAHLRTYAGRITCRLQFFSPVRQKALHFSNV